MAKTAMASCTLFLSRLGNIKNRFIKRFRNFGQLRAYAEDAEDYAVRTKIKVGSHRVGLCEPVCCHEA